MGRKNKKFFPDKMETQVANFYYPENVNYDSETDRWISFDLDETFVHTFDNYKAFTALNVANRVDLMPYRHRFYSFDLIDTFAPAGTGEIFQQWGVIRPGAREFIRFANQYFRGIIVWSAGKPEYVEKIVDRLWEGLRHPAIVYASNHCRNDLKQKKIKPLVNLIKESAPYFPDAPIRWDNLWALDDNPSTMCRNETNGILIPSYDPEVFFDGTNIDEVLEFSDDSLEELRDFLESPEVLAAEDVRDVNTAEIFSLSTN